VELICVCSKTCLPATRYLTQPQVFEKRYIKTGLSDGINIQILEGLDEDTKIKSGTVEG